MSSADEMAQTAAEPPPTPGSTSAEPGNPLLRLRIRYPQRARRIRRESSGFLVPWAQCAPAKAWASREIFRHTPLEALREE